MDELISFLVTQTAIEGERGASLPRLWYFVACFQKQAQVHPSHIRHLPLEQQVTTPTELEAVASAPTAPAPTSSSKGKSQVASAATDLVHDPNIPIDGLDASYLNFLWSVILEDLGQYVRSIRGVARRVESKKSAASTKRRKTSSGAVVIPVGDDGTKVVDVWEASPIEFNELIATPLAKLYQRYGDHLRLYIPANERELILSKTVTGDMSDQLRAVYDEILRHRTVGITQAHMSRSMGLDPRSTFHFIKMLFARNLVIKVPIVHRGNTTHLCLATQYAPFNPSYQSMMQALAQELPSAHEPSASQSAQPQQSQSGDVGDTGGEEVDADGDVTMADDGADGDYEEEDEEGEGDGKADEVDNNEEYQKLEALGIPARPAITFPPVKDLLLEEDTKTNALPSMFNNLVRHRICALLAAQPEKALASESIMHAVGLRPKDEPRHRKWFNRTVASMVENGHVDLDKVRAAPSVTKSGTPRSRGAVIRVFRFKAPLQLPTHETPKGLLGSSAVASTSGAEVSRPAAADATPPDAVPSTSGIVKRPRDPALSQQSGVLLDLSFEYQIVRLLANAPNGLTGSQIRRQLGRIASRPFNKVMERLLDPKKPVPKQAVVLRKVGESRGRERRFRYFADEIDEGFLAAVNSGKMVEQATDGEAAAQGQEQPQGDVMGSANAQADGGEDEREEDSMDVDAEQTGLQAPPPHVTDGQMAAAALLSTATSSTFDSTTATALGPAPALPDSEAERLLNDAIQILGLSGSSRTTQESKRRQVVMLDIIIRNRVVEYNIDLLRQYDAAFYQRYPLLVDDEYEEAMHKKNQRSSMSKRRPQTDKKTMQRVVEHLRAAKLVEHQVITIPLLNGGFKFREFLAYKRAEPPVTTEEVMTLARTTELNQHSVVPPDDWGLKQSVAAPGFAASNPLRHDSAAKAALEPDDSADPDVTPAPDANGETQRQDQNETAAAATPSKPARKANKSQSQDHWRSVSIDYGWIDARMLRAKKLYQLLYDITAPGHAANPDGPAPIVDTASINNRMSLGLYVQLIGHTDESELLEQALADDFDTPLADIDLRVRLELLGHEKKLRRYKMNLSLLINILTALNVIHPVDRHGSPTAPTFNNVTEVSVIAGYYTVPRTVRVLNYSAHRNERVEGDEYDLSTEAKMLAFWEMLEMARMPKRADPVDRANETGETAGSEETGEGGTADSAGAGEHADAESVQPTKAKRKSRAAGHEQSSEGAVTEGGDSESKGNPELDPIKFMHLPRNWIATQALNRKNRAVLMRSFNSLVRAGHVPYLMHIACLDIARQCNISLTHVKSFFRREYERGGLAATGVKATKVGEAPHDDVAPSLESAIAAAAIAKSQVPRVKKQRGNARAKAKAAAAAAAAAAASTFTDPAGADSSTNGGSDGNPHTLSTATVGPDGQVILDRRSLKRSVQILDPTTGKIDIARLKRTRVQWSAEEDQMLLYSYVILNQRVALGMARFISWQQVQVIFPQRHPDSIRRRINALIRNPNYMIRIKHMERLWASHSAECSKCNPQSLEHLEPVAGVVAGYHNLDLVTGVDHLSKIPIDADLSVGPDEPGLPDSLEELMQAYDIVEPEPQVLAEKVEQEVTTRARMLTLYDHALYIPEPSADIEQSPLDQLLAGSALSKRTRTRSQPNQEEARAAVAAAAAAAPAVGDTELAVSDTASQTPAQPNESTRLLPEEREKVPLAIELVKMMCLTPDPQYDPARAYMLLAQFSHPVIETAVQLIRNEGALVKCRPSNNRSRSVPGRNYALSDRFCAQLFGHHAQQQIAQAVRCLNDLNVHIKSQQQQSDPADPPTEEDHMFTLDDFVDEGTMLALIDLLVAGHIRLSVQVDMAQVFGMQIVPARSRDFAMDMSVIMHVLPSLPEPTVMMSGDRVPSTHPSVLAQAPMLGQTDGNSLEPVPMVRVGLLEHVWVDPRDLTTMAEHCVRRATTSVAPMQQSETLILADGETGVQEPDDDDVVMIHPTLRPWIVPRIWNNIHGHVVPAIWRSAMTCILAWLMKCPGARVSWLHDRLKLVFAKTEVIELVEQLEQRKAVVTQVVDGEMHVFLVEGFFYRIL